MNILLAVGDMRFSDAALDAIVAQRRPHAQNMSVRVVHVIDLPPLLAARELIGDDEELEKTRESEREMKRAAVTIVADELRSHGIRAAASLEIGDTKAKILEIANQWPADLVIVGAPRPRGLQSLLRRSVSLSVAKHAPCSVEIVRNGGQVTGIYNRDPRLERTAIIPVSFASGVRTGRTSTVRRRKMRLSLRAMVMAGAILWGGAILLVGVINFFDPNYGVNFLQMTRSVYPWFHSTHALGNVLIGTIDGVVDGAIAALFFAWLYNIFAGERHRPGFTQN